ncbi:MAG: cyclophilin-like fold protein [Thermoproteota archaeon]
MSEIILIKFESAEPIKIEIKKQLNQRTAEAILKALPFTSEANRWGDEIYFEIPVELGEEVSKVEVEKGDVAYWPPGKAMCIFFGPTPVSKGNKILAYSPVNVFGRVLDDYNVLKKVKDGEKVRVYKP